MYYFVYILFSESIQKYYTGHTDNIDHLFATDKDIGDIVFVNAGVALIGALTSDFMLRLVLKGVKKIVKPKPN